MSHTFLSRFMVKPDREAEFVSLIPQMEANSAEEAGTLGYKFYRLETPHQYAVFESFVDAAADEAHQANDRNKPIIERIIQCLDGGYVREYLLPIESK
jgi:autoinducer 2-degrading protein